MDLGELWGSLNLDDGPFTNALKGALGSLSDFKGKGIAIAGAAGAAVALAFGASVVANMNIEAAQDKIAASLDLTEEESARAGRVAGQAYANNYGESLGEVQSAVGSVISSIRGMREASDGDLQAMTEKVLNLAEVFEVDVDRAAQVAGQAVTSGLAKNGTQAMNLLTTGLQRVPKALRDDLLDAVDEYGPMFAQLGYTGKEAFALLVDASEKGMYGIDKAGDAVKEFTIRSTDMSTASQEAYETIGLDAEEMSNKILNGGEDASEGFQQVVDGLLKIEDPATRANTAIALFGTPIEDLSTNDIPKFLKSLQSGSKSMNGFKGSADRMADTLSGNSLATLSRWKRGFEMAFYGISSWAIPAIDAFITKIDETLAPLGGLQTAAVVLAGIIGSVLIPALIVWGIQSLASATIAAGSWIIAQLGAIATAAAYVAAFLVMSAGWIATAAVATANAVIMAAAWFIALGPIGWVIAAIAALVLFVALKWDWVKAKTKAAWDWVVAQVRKVPGLILGFFLNWTLPGLIIKHWGTIKSTFQAGVAAVIGFVQGLPDKIKGFFSGAGTWLLTIGSDIMSGLLDGINRGFEWVKDKLEGVGRLIPGWLKKVLGIASPSKVMRDEVGFWIPAGVADGIDDGTPLVTDAMSAMARAATTSLTSSTSVGMIGSLSGGPSVFDGPFSDMAVTDSGGGIDLSDDSIRRLGDYIITASRNVSVRTVDTREYDNALPGPDGGVS